MCQQQVDVFLDFESGLCVICGGKHHECYHWPDRQCIRCGASSQDSDSRAAKRLKLDNNANQTKAFPKHEILTLDPRGHGWRLTQVPGECPALRDSYETYDMVLTHDIKADDAVGTELYNNYGKLRNSDFLTRYGILMNWEFGLENSVCLRRQLFDTEHAELSGRCEYWKSNGFELLLGVAEGLAVDDYETVFDDMLWVDRHPSGDAFVDASLVVTPESHLFYPLSVWLLLLLLPDPAWTDFEESTHDEQVKVIRNNLTSFDAPVMTLEYLEFSIRCLKLLLAALAVRKSKYSERVDAILNGKIDEGPLDLVITFIMCGFS